MLPELLAVVEVLSKAKDVHDLIAQEQLKTLIKFLETLSKVHVRTAVEEMQAAAQSTRPDEERSRAIGQLKVAAQALSESVERGTVLQRLTGREDTRKMRAHLQITGCYLIVTSLYRTQPNYQLAQVYAGKASEAFENYAKIRRRKLAAELAGRFTYNSGSDQAPQVSILDSKELNALMRRYRITGLANEGTFGRLADAIVREERERLFAWLGPLRRAR